MAVRSLPSRHSSSDYGRDVNIVLPVFFNFNGYLFVCVRLCAKPTSENRPPLSFLHKCVWLCVRSPVSCLMSVLGIKLWLSARTVCALDHWAIFLAQFFFFRFEMLTGRWLVTFSLKGYVWYFIWKAFYYCVYTIPFFLLSDFKINFIIKELSSSLWASQRVQAAGLGVLRAGCPSTGGSTLWLSNRPGAGLACFLCTSLEIFTSWDLPSPPPPPPLGHLCWVQWP